MADASRRKGGATAARSHQAYLQQQLGAQAGTPTNRGYAKPSNNGRGGQKGQLPAKMGIKSGMTVEVRPPVLHAWLAGCLSCPLTIWFS